MRRIPSAVILVALGSCSGERSDRPCKIGDVVARLETFVRGVEVGASEGGAWILPPDGETTGILGELRDRGVEAHLPYLLEYGLKFHRACLDHSRLSRELPVGDNAAFRELVRLARIPRYRTLHEAGWLSHQFQGPFERSGWSSFQVYLWAKERSNFDDWPNGDRILRLLAETDASPACRIGGDNVCHYGCR